MTGPPVAASFGRMAARALCRRCPRCGSKGIFVGWFRMVDACPGCGYRFEGRPEEGFFLGAYAMNLVVTLGALLLLVFVYIGLLAAGRGDEALWPVLLVGVGIAVVVPVVFYPFSKTLWAAIDLGLRSMGERRGR